MDKALHARRHPSLEVPGCYACKMANVSYIGYRESQNKTRTNEKANTTELQRYYNARMEGIQPLRINLTDEATAWSDKHGRPFRGDRLSETLYPEETKELKEHPVSPENLRPAVVRQAIARHKEQAGKAEA